MRGKNSIKDLFREHILAVIFVMFMAVIYLHMMFTNGPWYDELYTYYYFISRGPVYAAIHWPVPNNHVGYSVLSAFFDFFGNPYVGLRGVSLIASVANLILLYKLCIKALDKYLSLFVTALYAGAYLVFRLSVQGRGYSLATTCFLLATLACMEICTGNPLKRYYLLFAASLCYGLYIVPSSIYWVMPVCIAGGLYLLFEKEYVKLLKLFLSGVCAAIVTFFLYAIIWLAIGANLLCKEEGSAFFGMGQVSVILKAPFTAMVKGIEYMTDTPYIQSIDRGECIKGLFDYFSVLCSQYYDRIGTLVLVLFSASVVISIISLFTEKTVNKNKRYMLFFVVSCSILVPVMLIIQSVHPYKRVLSFYLIPLLIAFAICILGIFGAIRNKKASMVAEVVAMCLSVLYCICNVLGGYYNQELAEVENKIESAFEGMNPSEIDTIYYTDDFQKYVLKFYHDVMPAEVYTLAEANYVVIGPEQLDESYTEPVWPVLYPFSQGLLDDVERDMEEVSNSEGYTVYKRR
ncbi:MAG: glycosyltransferase family 39 protein [Butyrivibrio sp.]|nr:glycosyltransferase family 39 protein [Butyrivibrio sp.]